MWRGGGNVKGGSVEWGDFPIIGHTQLIFQICVGELCKYQHLHPYQQLLHNEYQYEHVF